MGTNPTLLQLEQPHILVSNTTLCSRLTMILYCVRRQRSLCWFLLPEFNNPLCESSTQEAKSSAPGLEVSTSQKSEEKRRREVVEKVILRKVSYIYTQFQIHQV